MDIKLSVESVKRVELIPPDYQSGVLPLHHSALVALMIIDRRPTHNVSPSGIEPATPGLQPSVYPLTPQRLTRQNIPLPTGFCATLTGIEPASYFRDREVYNPTYSKALLSYYYTPGERGCQVFTLGAGCPERPRRGGS